MFSALVFLFLVTAAVASFPVAVLALAKAVS